MQIAHVTFTFWPVRGGADAYLAELYRVLECAGHAQTIYQARPAALGPIEHPAVVPLDVPPTLSAGQRFWRLSLEIARRRSEFNRYDRVIAHYPNYALPLLGHPGLTGLSHGVTWDCRDASRQANRLKWAIAAAAFRRADRYVANDTLFLREMRIPIAPGAPGGSEPAPRRFYIPNGVDIARFSPDPDVERMPWILVARNLYRNRGVHLALAAFAAMEHDRDLRMRIVGGPGDPGYEEECRDAAQKLGIADRVDFLGPVPWSQMAGEYRRASATLVPSLCGEGTSLTALESMACGTPVVATRAGGLSDLPCFHADARPASLAAALEAALRARARIGIGQRTAVVAEFSLEQWANRWLAAIER